MIEKERLMTFRNYAAMKGVTVPTVYLWERNGKINVENMDGVKFVVLTDEEVKQRESLFSQHPTKGLHRIGDVMSAMFNGKAEDVK